MLAQLKRNIVQGNQFNALSICGSAEKPMYYAVKAKLVKGELNIVDTFCFEKADATTLNDLGNGQLHLNINNHQVLHKKLPKSEASPEVLVQQAFHNIQIEDFYYEVLKTKQAVFVCMCRKEYINDLITQYAKDTIVITQWSLGPLCLEQLLPFMEEAGQIQLPEQQISIVEGSINVIEKRVSPTPTVSYAIENMQVASEYILPFAGVLRSFMQFDTSTVSNYANKLSMQQRLFKEHRLFRLGLPVGVGILLVIFLVNFMLYNFYFQEVNRLEQITQVNTMQRDLLIAKDSIVGQKQKLFDDVIASASSSASLFVDEMVGIMPDALVLDEINYQPVLRKVRKNKVILLEENHLLVGGKTRNNLALTQWISDLEDLSFIQDATLKVETKGSITQFEIAISLVSP